MDFYAVLDQVLALLRQRGRVSYRALKRQFDLDDAYLDDLKVEIIEVHQWAVEQGGTMLVWTGEAASAATPEPVQAPAPLAYTPPYLAEKILTSRSALEGERKQVTVLFADLKDSTELIRGLDPEAAQQLLDPALHHMMDAVHRFEGTVNQVLGDGIMALFGAPIAREDHALRACYAALAMQAAMQPYTEEVRRTRGLELRMRVGLNSGEVVVRAIGNDLHMDYSAVGETTVLAARMEQTATPGSIRLTPATLRLVEGLVRVNALGPIPVKGLTEPVEVYEVLGASTLRRRLQAAAARGLTRFVGRQHELGTLSQSLEHARTGHGQVVAFIGEAGVGKSRLVYEVVHSPHTQGWRVLESASVSYGKATAYFPVIDLLKRYAYVEDGDDTRTIRAKLTGQVLTLDAALQEALPALLGLLDALPDDSPFLTLDPPHRRQRTLDALKRLLLRESQEQPLLLVFEDLHWIDTETQALLDSLVESLPTVHLLLLVNYRPEYQHGWGSKTYYTQVRLDPLPPASADELLQALLGDNPSLAPLKQLLIERTEGNPFFLEESVRTLVETGVVIGERGAYRLAQPLESLQMPATVHAVLAARIDRLPPEEKHLLQTAGVIGHDIPLPLLQAIAELPEDALHRGLAHLQAAEFLYETRLFPERELRFKHALTHEVAYSTLLQERRRVLHTRIVLALEALTGDRMAEQVEHLAHHAFRGEVWDKALVYGRQAGEKMLAQSAYREAAGALEQALSTLPHLPATRALHEQAIDLRFDLRTALAPLDEHARILDHLSAAETLAKRLDDPQRLARIACYLCVSFSVLGEHARAMAAGQRALALATTSGAGDIQPATQTYLGLASYAGGDFHQALDVSRQVRAVLTGRQRSGHLGQAMLPAVVACVYIAWSLSEGGDFVEARAAGQEAMQLAEAAAHSYSMAGALLGVGVLARRQGDLATATPLLERGLALCQHGNFRQLFPLTAASLSVVYALAGRATEAHPFLDQVLKRLAAGSHVLLQALVLTELSEALLRGGRVDEAGALAGDLLNLSRSHIGRGYQAHASRILGDVALHRDPPDVEAAHTQYHQALALADTLGMRPLQAHCQGGLGTLYAKTGQVEQARTALATAIALYRAMDMTFWLPQAEATLAQVEGR